MSVRTILVADEDADTRIILRTVLERNGFVIVEAANADDAVVAARQCALDLVILNYPMPDRTGSTLVYLLRALPSAQYVPILNLTSRVVPQFLDDAEREGVALTIPKPIDVAHILTIVAQLTSQPVVGAR